MIRKKTLAFALAGTLVIGAAGPLYGQIGHEPMPMTGMMQHCPMRMGMAHGPVAALRHAEALDLTPDQVARLESLRDESRVAHRAAMERMRAIHEEIAVATADTFDEAAVRAAFARMGDVHGDMGVAMLRTRHQSSRVLTGEQREELAGLYSDPMDMMGSMEGMEGMMGMHGMMEMMKNCPMMHGGMGSGSGEDHQNMRHPQGGAR